MLRAQETRLESLRQRLEDLAAKRVLTDQLAYVQDKRMDLLHAQQRLGDLSEVLLNRKRQRFAALAAALDAMSPLKVLGRGYAMARDETGGIIKSYRDVTAGQKVSVTLGEGGFTAAVKEPWKEGTK